MRSVVRTLSTSRVRLPQLRDLSIVLRHESQHTKCQSRILVIARFKNCALGEGKGDKMMPKAVAVLFLLAAMVGGAIVMWLALTRPSSTIAANSGDRELVLRNLETVSIEVRVGEFSAVLSPGESGRFSLPDGTQNQLDVPLLLVSSRGSLAVQLPSDFGGAPLHITVAGSPAMVADFSSIPPTQLVSSAEASSGLATSGTSIRCGDWRTLEDAQQNGLGAKVFVFPPHGDLVTLASGAELVRIPPGVYVQGASPPSRAANRLNQSRVTTITRGFYMLRTEVTTSLWASMSGGPAPSASLADLPKGDVSWNDARQFCERISRKGGLAFRLPTEAEWEYACRAGTTSDFFFLDPYQSNRWAWSSQNSFGRPRPVASLAPNPWGLYDMAGSVRELCQDWFGLYDPLDNVDPTGPRSGSLVVRRGGSYALSRDALPSPSRDNQGPDYHYPDVGFRVVVDEESVSENESRRRGIALEPR
jgi:formylglycine-generating enzyme required for sulfatase activity